MFETSHLPTTPGVYSIRHSSGQEYIGSSINMRSRVKKHLQMLLKGSHGSHRLRKLWLETRGVGWECLLLEECEQCDLSNTEQYYFEISSDILNITPYAFRTDSDSDKANEYRMFLSGRTEQLNASGRLGGHLRSPESVAKHAELMSRYSSEGRIGTSRWSEETYAKASASQSRRMGTDEAREKQSRKAKQLHSEGRLGAVTWKEGEREARSRRLKKLNTDGGLGPKHGQAGWGSPERRAEILAKIGASAKARHQRNRDAKRLREVTIPILSRICNINPNSV